MNNNYERADHRAGRSMTMTTDDLERLRLAAEDAAGGPPSVEQVEALVDLVDALEAALAALTTPQDGDVRERIATVIRRNDPNKRVIDWEYLSSDAILAAFPALSRDIAGEIDAEREDTDYDALGADAYINGLLRAAEIVRNGR